MAQKTGSDAAMSVAVRSMAAANVLGDAISNLHATYAEVAALAGCSPAAISRIVAGKRVPSGPLAARIGSALEILATVAGVES